VSDERHAPPPGPEVAMGSIDDNKALVTRFYAEIDAGNLSAMDELVAEGYIDHHPPPIPGLPPGRDGLKAAFEIFARCTPGTHEILDQIGEDDLVMSRIRARGRFVEDMGDIPATGADMDVTATAVHRIRDGQLVEHWGEVDSFKLMQDLGVVPS
jgi:predicted SnoaL-like aldol condensation-catalyzing enzyme